VGTLPSPAALGGRVGGAPAGRSGGLRLVGTRAGLGILRLMATAAGTRLRCEQCDTEVIVVKGTDTDVVCCQQPMTSR